MTDELARVRAALADKYSIEREIGAGGMATVYLAEDIKHDRRVAVKVLRPELAAAEHDDAPFCAFVEYKDWVRSSMESLAREERK